MVKKILKKRDECAAILMVVAGRNIEKNKMGTIQWNIGMGIESLV